RKRTSTDATGSCSNSNCFATSMLVRRFIPVAFPPGRLILATRPNLTGFLGRNEDDRNRRGYPLGRECRDSVACNHGHLATNEITGHHRPPISRTSHCNKRRHTISEDRSARQTPDTRRRSMARSYYVHLLKSDRSRPRNTRRFHPVARALPPAVAHR